MVKPMPPFFLVKIPRDKQKERQEKIGSLYLHPNYIYMTRNMQCGEVVAIGEVAHEVFPEVQVGQMLLFHHFVEGFANDFLVDSDDEYGYFVVTACTHHGQNNQTYAVWTGKEIIPNQDYIFLTAPPPPESVSTDEFMEAKTKMNPQGIALFKNWYDNRESLINKMKELKSEIESLCKSRMNEQLAIVIKNKEAEAAAIQKKLMEKRYEQYIVEAINPLFNIEVTKIFGSWIVPGDKVYMLNIACETKVEFNRKEYIVAKTMHMGMPVKWVTKKITQKKFA